MSDQGGLQQRKPTGCGVIPARASAAGTESLSHSAQCLPGHTWNAGLIFFLLCKKEVDRLERAQRRATKVIQRLGSCHAGKGWEDWVCSAFREEGLGDNLSPCPNI